MGQIKAPSHLENPFGGSSTHQFAALCILNIGVHQNLSTAAVLNDHSYVQMEVTKSRPATSAQLPLRSHPELSNLRLTLDTGQGNNGRGTTPTL